MISRFRLLVVCGNDGDVTSFYRGLGPLSQLRKTMGDRLEIVHHWGEFDFNQNRLRMVDGLFIQRPSADFHVFLAKLAKNLGIPIWTDLDDDVFELPEEHPGFLEYHQKQIPQFTAECLRLSNVVTTTTEFLKQRFAKVNEDVRVIPNAFDDALFLRKKKEPGEGKPVILWRGSNTHNEDLRQIVGSLERLSFAHKNQFFVFLGSKPTFITKDMREHSWKHIAWNENTVDYFDTLNRIQPKLVIVPLMDIPFNRAKSNIAWIEGSFANAAVLAPKWPEWERPGVLHYANHAEFHRVLSGVMDGDVELGTHAAQSWSHIQTHLLLSQVNGKRQEILEEWMK